LSWSYNWVTGKDHHIRERENDEVIMVVPECKWCEYHDPVIR